jgi:peptidoglycan/LPS O-acetylase OafA/YrhL
MLPTIGDPLIGTALVAAALAVGLSIGARRRAKIGGLDEAATTELKGAAALAVIFCHVGYFLIDDHRFLFPLSAAGGVAVDAFLLLSGFGLALGALKRDLRPLAFYRRRLLKLFSPLWLSLVIVLALDFWRLGLVHPWSETALAFIGVVPQADLYTNINSPLWYVTLALFLYGIFPWLFRRVHPYWSVAWLAVAGYVWADLVAPRLLPGVAGLYGVHRFAFPLGVLLAVLASREKLKTTWRRLGLGAWTFGRRLLVSLALAAAIGYLLVHSGVGQGPSREEAISLLIVLLAVALAAIKPWRFTLLAAFGAVSYEIYLLHWPLLARHDWLFAHWPSWAAMTAWLVLLYGAGRAMKVALSWGRPK